MSVATLTAHDWKAAAERIIRDGPEPLSRLARLVPASRERGDHCNSRGPRGHCSAYTLQRWATKGKEGVRLDAVRMSGGWCSSKAALARFFAALTERAVAGAAFVPNPTAAERAAQAAADELARMRRGR